VDPVHWTLWESVACPFYYKNNTVYNDIANGGPDFYMWSPLSVDFQYETANNKVYYLSTDQENINATHMKYGAKSVSLDDSTYEIESTGEPVKRPEQITNFPYGE
jgi:hypothetical protein